MKDGFIRATENAFQVRGQDLYLKSIGIGSFLNHEFFMLGLYGTDADIRRCIEKVHGKENARTFWNEYYQRFLGEADIRFIKELGFNSIRLSFSWRIFESDAGDGAFDEKGFAQLDRIVRLCREHGIYAILDMHSAPGGQNPDWHSDNPTGVSLLWEFPELKRKTISIWQRIAHHYRDDPWIGGYDLLNEPVIHPERAGEVDRLYHDLVAAVRKEDLNHLCLIEGFFYGGTFKRYTPVDDENTAYSPHIYPFFHYLGRSDEELAALDPAEEQRIGESYLASEEFQHVRNVLKRPMWCGETGTFYCPELGNTEFHLKMFQGFLGLLRKHRIPWSFWTYKDIGQMGLMRMKQGTAWMKMAARLQSDVSFIQESRLLQAEDERLKQYAFPIDPYTKHILKRRTIADQQMIMTEKMESVLAGIPFPELLASTGDFRFANCEPQPELVRMLRDA